MMTADLNFSPESEYQRCIFILQQNATVRNGNDDDDDDV